MAKMTAEERHKRQLAKLQAKTETTENTYVPQQSEKDLILEKIKKKGYEPVIEQGVPMFPVSTQKEVDEIRSIMDSKGSFGFKYDKNTKISFSDEEEEVGVIKKKRTRTKAQQ